MQGERPLARYLDCRNLQCPEPIVQLFLEIQNLDDGEELTIEATDPAFAQDLQAWIEMTGHELCSLEESDSSRTATVRKRGGDGNG